MRLLPEPFAMLITSNGKWDQYRIRAYVLYVGRYRGERDFRLIHSRNRVLDTFAAVREMDTVEEDPS